MTAREAVERHPSVLVGYAPIAAEIGQYDLRDVALRLIEDNFPTRIGDWWCSERRVPRFGLEARPIYSLGTDVHHAAMTLIVKAMSGEVYEHATPYGKGSCYARAADDPPYRYEPMRSRRSA